MVLFCKTKIRWKSKTHMDKDSFIVYIKIDDINKHIAEDVKTRFDTSNYKLDSPLPKGKN